MMEKFLEMIAYARPSKTPVNNEFCNKFLKPVFGKADENGNFYKCVGDGSSRTMFAAHWDTVDSVICKKSLVIDGTTLKLSKNSKGNCLGADCTTGVWLILEMIAANVPGHYVIFASEEAGCIGSRAMVNNQPDWLSEIDHCISFDRKGTSEVITHQCSFRTASDAFANALGDAIGLGMTASDRGVYTDSNEFASDVSECTNVAVGYFNQHTRLETQNLMFLANLRDRLIEVDFASLPAKRDPTAYEFSDFNEGPYSQWGYYGRNSGSNYAMTELEEIIRDYPLRLADWFESNGIDADTLKFELGID